MDELAARRQASIDLAMPRFPDAAGRTITTAAAIPASKETRWPRQATAISHASQGSHLPPQNP